MFISSFENSFFFVLWNVITLIETLFNIRTTHVACKIFEENMYDCFSNSWSARIVLNILSKFVQEFNEIDLKQICLIKYAEWFLRISTIMRNTKSAFCFNFLIDTRIWLYYNIFLCTNVLLFLSSFVKFALNDLIFNINKSNDYRVSLMFKHLSNV